MNAKLKFGIHQLAVKVHLGECSLNYIGRYNTKWCAGRPNHRAAIFTYQECNITPPAMAEGKCAEQKRPR